MNKLLCKGVAALIGLAGCANLADAGLFSATGPVIAILSDELLVGEAIGHLGEAGSISIQSKSRPDLSCVGQFVYSDHQDGSGQLQCSDGAVVTFKFQRLSLLRGYGVSNSGGKSMSFTYGLTAAESQPYLKLPPGKMLRLKLDSKELELADQ